MGTTPITTTFLLTSISCVVLLELVAGYLANRVVLPRMELIGAVRTVQALVVALLAVVQTGDMTVLGLGKKSILNGLKKGAIWSAGFAAFAGLLFFALFFAGKNPLSLVRSPLPGGMDAKITFFLVGGVIAPVAEEILFRGVIFGYLRRWGLTTAVLVSTALFASLHLGSAIPVTQIVGGVVFALAYHSAKSLVAPIVIHILGNLAIFSLSLPLFTA